ncbi:hypothetical protein GGR51DRAFT_550100 [Nemania sp. FL0031]|nr:hypothetical protein GGR51DRAFT_550100 [Nemania sp. FL0031]
MLAHTQETINRLDKISFTAFQLITGGAIIALSRRYTSNSTFPGNSYIGLGQWILQDRSIFNTEKLEDESVLFASQSKKSHDLVVVYDSGEKEWEVQHYSQEQHQAFSSDTIVPTQGSGQLVFIRGFISPSWVSVLGSKYNIDPEYFRQHMNFLSVSVERHAYSFPSLSSSSNNIFRLCVSTLVHRDDMTSVARISNRSDRINPVRCGDSLVREYSTICPSFSVMEQWISVFISKTDGGWAVIAWMDQGRPLEESPPGLWTSHIESKAIALPVLQSHHKMAFRTTTNRLDSDANASAEVQQSTAVFPLQYDSVVALVDLARCEPQDPLHMCIPLFAHAAFSEVQFLNLMESKIQAQTDAIAHGAPANRLETYQYFFRILDRHAQQLNNSLRALQRLAERSDLAPSERRMARLDTPMRTGPGADPPRQVETKDVKAFRGGTFTARELLEDYECNWGISLAMNKATIEESRKAIEQSGRVKKLTILATLFIPLNFSSSLFGMNIEILGQGHLAFWCFFVLCVPITLFAYIFYLWDFQALKNQWRNLCGICSYFRLGRRAKWTKKDRDHFV